MINPYRLGVRNLKKELQVLEAIEKFTKAFQELQYGSTMKAKTFHALVANNILLEAMKVLIKENKKTTKRYQRKLIK